MELEWLLFKSFFVFIPTICCHSEVSRKTKVMTSADVQSNTACYSFFGEFRENGSFQFIELPTVVKCNQKVQYCFVEFYRLAYYTWFNGQCDDSFACVYESDYAFSNGCQATLHGGDRCCCSNKLCNFDIILKERPYFVKYLPQRQVLKSESVPLESHCGKVKKVKSN